MEITKILDPKKITTLQITRLDKGYFVQGAGSPNTLGSMAMYTAACATEKEVADEVGSFLACQKMGEDPAESPAEEKPEPAPAAPVAEPPAAAEPTTDEVAVPVTNSNREAVIDFLTVKGHELVKGVRNTTLTKLLEEELAKDEQRPDEPAPVADEPAPVAEEPEVEPADEPAPVADACKLCFGTGKIPGDIDCPHCAKGGDLTQEVVRSAVNTILNRHMDKRSDLTKAAATAVGKLGFQRFPEIKDFNAGWKAIREELRLILDETAAPDKGDDEWPM